MDFWFNFNLSKWNRNILPTVDAGKSSFNLDDVFENYDERLAYYIYVLNKKSYPFEFNVAKMDTKKKVMTKENIKEFSKCIDSILS